jgi:hypothetical protein
MKSKVIRVDELRKISKILFDYLEECDVREIELEHDYYWDVFYGEKFDILNNKEPEIVCGQLYDDWEVLERVLGGEDEPLNFMNANLAKILEYIGYRVIG